MLQDTENKPENADTIKSLTAIQRNSVRLIDIIHDFIDVMQLEGNTITVEKETFDLVQLTKEIVADLSPVAAKKKLFLKLEEPQASIPMIIADSEKTRQVVVNIIGNAIHYTEKGGVTILISTTKEANGDFVQLSITDTGAGIAPESRATLFQKFSTVQKTFLHTKEYGSGLGLYIAKTFTEAMGGSIRLEKSIVNEGSTFTILLPVAPMEAEGKSEGK